jgi:hypothetical protein
MVRNRQAQDGASDAPANQSFHVFNGEERTQEVPQSKIKEDEYLFVGEYIFETFYEPIDDKSYDSENDCGTNKQQEILRKNEHSMTPSSELT